MPVIADTAYPRLPVQPGPAELEAFTPSAAEIAFARQRTRQPGPRLALLVLLRTFQHLGHVVRLADVPAAVLAHVAASACLARATPDLAGYDDTTYRVRLATLVRAHAGVDAYDPEARGMAARACIEAARTRDGLADIVDAGVEPRGSPDIEELLRCRRELPAFSALLRLARSARTLANRGYHRRVAAALGALPSDHPARGAPGRHLVRMGPGQGGPAAAQPAAHARAPGPPRLAAGAGRDTGGVRGRAGPQAAPVRGRPGPHNGKQAPRVDGGGSGQIAQALDGAAERDARLAAVKGLLLPDADAILAKCEAHAAFAGNNYLPLPTPRYGGQRAAFLPFLAHAAPVSTSQDRGVERAIAFLLAHRTDRRARLRLIVEAAQADAATARQALDLSWVGEKWWPLLTGHTARDLVPAGVGRRYFEICPFTQVANERKSGDLCIPGSEECSDYREQRRVSVRGRHETGRASRKPEVLISHPLRRLWWDRLLPGVRYLYRALLALPGLRRLRGSCHPGSGPAGADPQPCHACAGLRRGPAARGAVQPAHRLPRVRAETTKGRRERVVPCSAVGGEVLRAYLAHRVGISRARGPLFLSESRRNHAEPLTPWTWSKIVRRIALAAGVPRFGTHMLRYLCLTDLARAG